MARLKVYAIVAAMMASMAFAALVGLAKTGLYAMANALLSFVGDHVEDLE